MDEVYFFDTYALIEIIKGNVHYRQYQDVTIALTIFNIVELHYALLREFSPVIADNFSEKYAPFIVDIDLETIRKANKFKLQHRDRALSAADVIGYATAQKLGIKFLTGDEDFKDFPFVEFVKK